MTNQDLTKFELLLTLEGNIVVQRYFNVKGHNPKSRRSMDLHYYVKYICEEIFEDLKIKTSDYLNDNREYYFGLESAETNEIEDKENFLLEIKMGDDVFIQRMFPAYFFHPKVRYTVDIRPHLKRYLSDLTAILSTEELERTYLNYQL
jgi:hypothetical protein